VALLLDVVREIRDPLFAHAFCCSSNPIGVVEPMEVVCSMADGRERRL
jgi:hypothetical protein